MRQVFVRVLGIGQRNLPQRRLPSGNHFVRRGRAIEQRAAELGEGQITPTGNDLVGKFDDFLPSEFVADLGAAENDLDPRPRRFEQAQHGGGLPHVPEIDAEADDLYAWRNARRFIIAGHRSIENV